ncbi:hypothetical protein D9758_004600 [Tetrapyrgos nigripes]|uniref:Uncharacterized protein n=1 Tax=Tetrapyrgos nigripes TaxID=182062 RepID=A0A8H5H053_9AGAR|nr:hypothetical protein D9758_004600 [Tetrapyrgos nigripes]
MLHLTHGHNVDYNILFLAANWLEAVAYGFLFCMFCGTLYFAFGSGANRSATSDGPSKMLLGFSTSMFLIATIHACMSCYRLVQAYVFNRFNPNNGPAGFMNDLFNWSAVFYEALYTTQELLGGMAAIYRCWILWNRDFKVVAVPIALFIVSMGEPLYPGFEIQRSDSDNDNPVFGYGTDGMFITSSNSDHNIVHYPRLLDWICTFYSVAVVQNFLTTGLMIYAIYRNHRQNEDANVKSYGGLCMLWLMRTMIEAAALQLVIEILLLIFFLYESNIQYIFLDMVVPMIGITFNAMAISYRLRLLTEKQQQTTNSVLVWKPASVSATRSVSHGVSTSSSAQEEL